MAQAEGTACAEKPGEKRSTEHTEGWDAHMEGPGLIALVEELVLYPEGEGPLKWSQGVALLALPSKNTTGAKDLSSLVFLICKVEVISFNPTVFLVCGL